MSSVVCIARWVAASALCAAISAPSLRAETAPCAPTPVTRNGGPSRPAAQSSGAFTIASLNLAGQQEIGEALTEWAQTRQIDMLLLQEVGQSSFDGGDFVADVSERLGFHYVYAPANRMGNAHTQGLAIVSRYPFGSVRVLPLTYHHLRFKSRCRIALVATAAMTDGPLHVVNVHLDTRINSKERIAQLAPVLDALAHVDAPQLIGGDFNTMNIRWFRTMWPLLFLERQAAAVGARLAALGFHTPFIGTPATFRFPLFPFRLDWLYLKRLQPLAWNVDPVPLTDHRGVWAVVRR